MQKSLPAYRDSLSGNEDSHRVTLAYLFNDRSTKLKSSYGTGFRFPSLYETYYVDGGYKSVYAENSESFDFGIEKSFINLGLSIDASYFNVKFIFGICSNTLNIIILS